MLKFFDCNCMTGRIVDQPLPFDGIESLLKEMSYHNIEKAMVFHSLAWQCEAEFGNDLLLKEIEGNKNLYPVFVVCPWQSSREAFSDKTIKLIEQKACGIRFFPADNAFNFLNEELEKVMQVANARNLPVLIDYDQINDFGGLRQMLGLYPNVSFILSKISYGNNRCLYSLFEKYSNVHIETSLFRTYQGIEEVTGKFGAERILFGTYMPLIDAGASLCRVIYSGIKDEDKEKIAYKNIERIISGIKS